MENISCETQGLKDLCLDNLEPQIELKLTVGLVDD
jgi:hypothetical protein